MPKTPLNRQDDGNLSTYLQPVAGVDPATVKVPVVSYARISDDGEDDEHGVTNQHRRNRQQAERQGWTVVALITDNDVTATKADVVRDGFELMVSGLRTNTLPGGITFVGVVTAHQDRMCRRAGDYERFVDEFVARPGHVFADERGPLDLYSETVEGMGLIGVVFSKIEARKIARRLRDFHYDRIMDGKPPAGGNRPFGWLDDRITMDPIEGPLLAQAAHEHLGGRALNSIVREWHGNGVKTTTGRDWTTTSLKVALRNPRLCGWRRLNGEIVKDKNGRPYVGNWDALIDPDTWLALDAVFEARKGKIVGSDGIIGDIPIDFREHKHLLTGTLLCGKPREDDTLCTTRLRVSYIKGCKGHTYTCLPKSLGGCAGIGRSGRLVDKYVTEAVLAKLEERAAVGYKEQTWDRDEELQDFEDRFAELRRQWDARQISNEWYFADARELQKTINELRKEKNQFVTTAKRVLTDVTDLRERWFTSDPAKKPLDISEKRAYIQTALHAVIVHPVPPGGRGPNNFNPDLLELIWRESFAGRSAA